MSVTQQEIQQIQEGTLSLFTQVGAIKNSDQILMFKANAGGTTTPTKITAELLRAYLNAGFAITIDSEGYLVIGGVRTETMASVQQRIEHTATTVSVKPNVLNVWGAVSSLNLSFLTGATGQANEYMLEFTVSGNSFSLTIPSDVIWLEEEEPEWTDGYTYQVSVLDGLAIAASWPNSSSSQ